MAQYARPDSTIAAGGWSYSTLSLHEDTDEETPNGDTDYAEASSDDTTMELGLSSVSDPGSSTGHVLRFTAEALNYGGGPEKLDVDLYDTGGLICHAFVNEAINRGSYTEHEYTLAGDEADSISDYSTLEVHFIVDSLSGSEVIRVTQIEFEVPAGAQTFYQTCEGAITPAGGIERETGKEASIAGSLTPAGDVTVMETGKVADLGGSVTPTGLLERAISKLTNLVGSLTPTGVVVRKTSITVEGGATPSGDVDTTLVTMQDASGSLTPTGGVAPRAGKEAAGSLTPQGDVVCKVATKKTGSITPEGIIVLAIAKAFGGSAQPTGALATAYVGHQGAAGSCEPSGALDTLYIAGGGPGPPALVKGVSHRLLRPVMVEP